MKYWLLTLVIFLAPLSVSADTFSFGAFNATLGTVKATFIGWRDTPPCYAGKTTFIWWENTGVSLDSIISGSQDSVIKNFAAKVCPNTIVAPFHEMNGNWDSWGGTVGRNTPAKIIAAWRHIHDLIGSKVQYAWVVNNSDEPNRAGNRPADYWPSASYVDIVGVDGFDWGGETFMQAIAPNFDVVKSYGKPVWITSTGTRQSSKQTAWVQDAIFQAQLNGIAGWIYFSYYDGINFTLNSAALAALRSLR